MKPEQLQKIEQLYLAALERGGGQRSAFLDEACAEDADLRRKVEQLLAAHVPVASARTTVTDERPPSVGSNGPQLGQAFGPYRVLNLLGEGGMGQVYLAHDSRLGRKVALKLLSADYTGDEKTLHRFQQEARAVSSLNHPNILTVHEVGQVGESHFIATEFVDGQTLRQQISNPPMELIVVLDVALQSASALQAAHQAGIVHRDIKPENIMLRHDGLVKVLDFGIAKLMKEYDAPIKAGFSTFGGSPTETGILIGTPTYMSPEQARGQRDVDARADVFSLGVVLYEMATGRCPFAADALAESLAAVLYFDPPPPSRFRPEAPPELDRIVGAAINKDREQRYQTIEELRLNLAQLKEALSAARFLRPAQPAFESRAERANFEAASSFGAPPTRRRWRHQIGLIIALALALAVMACVWFYQPFGSKPPSFQPAIKMTAAGNISRAAISPNGKHIVYAKDDDGRQSLWVRQVSAAQGVQIVPPDEVIYHGLTFSPEGDAVYYVAAGKAAGSALYRIPTLGGKARKLLDDVDTPVTFSPDGRRFAFGRGGAQKGESLLVIAGADGAEKRKQVVHKLAGKTCLAGIAWSPDGKVIACSSSSTDKLAGNEANVVAVSESDGAVSRVSSAPWRSIKGLAWMNDGAGLIVVAAAKGALSSQLFHLSYPAGEASKVTTDSDDYGDVSLGTASKTLLATRTARVANLWSVAGDNAGQAKQLTTGAGIYYDLTCAPGGEIIASGELNNKLDVWRMDAEGKNLRQLTAGADLNFRGQLSADGRYVVYASNQNGVYNIWRMNADGTNAVSLTQGDGEYAPRITPDGKWVFYYRLLSGKEVLSKISIEGGQPAQFTDKPARFAAISPDGKFVACYYLDQQKWKVAVIPMTGGAPVRLLDIPGFIVRWTPDGKALTYLATNQGDQGDQGVSNLWSKPLDGGQPKRQTNFAAEQIFFFDWSLDGNQIVCLRGSETSDAFLLPY